MAPPVSFADSPLVNEGAYEQKPPSLAREVARSAGGSTRINGQSQSRLAG